MSVQLWIYLAAVSFGFMAFLLAVGPDAKRKRVQANLLRGETSPDATVGAITSDRALGLGKRLLGTEARLKRYEDMLARAGRPGNWTPERLLSIKVLLPLVMAAVFALFAVSQPSPMTIAMPIVTAILAFFLPDLLLYNEAIKRRQAIDLALADTLDQMSIAVQAGLGFDGAMLQVARENDGPLASEMMHTMQDLHVGRSRREAYEAMGTRTGSVAVRRFMRTIIQADAYGLSLSSVLQTQADEMRRVRRLEAERKAMQVPVKVLFPLMLCIMPALFVVILGPAVMNIAAAFGGR